MSATSRSIPSITIRIDDLKAYFSVYCLISESILVALDGDDVGPQRPLRVGVAGP